MRVTVDWRTAYPFESRELRFGGVRYHYLDEGRGPALLVLHGNPTWSFYYRKLITGLRDRYRLIVPDHVGCGLSDKPHDYHYRLDQHIANVQALIHELDLKQITLVAHDWGGAIGMGAAVAEADRFARFVLLNTAAFRSSRIPLRIRICRTPVLGKLAVQGLNGFARAALWMAVADRRRLSPEARAGLIAPYDSWDHRRATHQFVLDIPLSPSHPSYRTLESIERGLAQFRDRPWMFIWGMQDWCFTPHFLERFLEFIPNAEVHRLADVGHYVMEEAPERVVPLVEQFLQKHPLPAERTNG